MLVCVDGIAGIGKSTLLDRLERRSVNGGLSTCKLHFFSDVTKLRPFDRNDPIGLERELLTADVESRHRARVFRHLCRLACNAVLRTNNSWQANLMLFDRSPISYCAYCEGALGVRVKLTTKMEETVAMLRPIVLVGNVLEAHRRVQLRDSKRTKGIFHRLTLDQDERVQESYINTARILGLPCEDTEAAWRRLERSVSGLQSGIVNERLRAFPK